MGKLVSFDCPDELLNYITKNKGNKWSSKSDGIRVLIRKGKEQIEKEDFKKMN